jgi:hypothetical protein
MGGDLFIAAIPIRVSGVFPFFLTKRPEMFRLKEKSRALHPEKRRR